MQPIICPQKETAEWLGITARRLRQLQQAGHLPGFDRGAVDLKALVQAYCRHMAEVAAGRKAGLPELAGGLPLRGGAFLFGRHPACPGPQVPGRHRLARADR